MSSECNQTSSTLTGAPTEQERADALASVLRALGAGPCKTTSATAGGVSLLPPVFGGAAVSTAIGCEQLDVVVNTVVATQRNLNCLVREIVQTQSTFAQSDQYIHIVINDIDRVGNLNIQQASRDELMLLTSLSDSDKLNIADQLKQFNTDFFKSIQDSKTGYLATPQGQKSITDFRTNFSEENLNKVINKTISDVEQNVDVKQRIDVEINGYDPMSTRYFSVGTINISQESYILIKSSQILNTFLDQVFKTDMGQTLKQDITKGMKADAKGLDSLIGQLFGGGILLLALLAVGLFLFGGSVAKYIIPIGLIASVAGAIFYGLKKPPQVVYTAIAGALAVLLAVLEVVSLKSGGAKSSGR